MANSDRRYIDNNGNQFMPMNVEGGSWDEHFINTKKLIFIGVILFGYMFIALHIGEATPPLSSCVLYLLLWTIISVYILRFIVFEERFYYRMYKVLNEYEYSTPAIFWDIASIRNTPDGAILTYSDTKIGILVKLERDTITGKHPDFKEVHYDAISDFYKELVSRKYKFVQLNVMERAGNDPRLEALDPLVHKSDNNNICKLMEKEIGYIKNITHNTLYESDYILIYTTDLTKVDGIINDAIDCIYKILDGAYIGYRILTSRDIIEFVKEQYGVKYFNYTQATLDMYKMAGTHTENPFTLSGIEFTDGKIQDLDSYDINKIKSLTSDILSGAKNIDDVSIRDAISKKKRKESDVVDFDNISQGFYVDNNSVQSNQNQKGGRLGRFIPKRHSNNLANEDFFDEISDLADDENEQYFYDSDESDDSEVDF